MELVLGESAYKLDWYPDRAHARWLCRPTLMRGDGRYAECWALFWGWWVLSRIDADPSGPDDPCHFDWP